MLCTVIQKIGKENADNDRFNRDTRSSQYLILQSIVYFGTVNSNVW